MAETSMALESDRITGRGHSLNPFVILKDAVGFITFAQEVFDASEVVDARTPTPAGQLIPMPRFASATLCCFWRIRRRGGNPIRGCSRSGWRMSRN